MNYDNWIVRSSECGSFICAPKPLTARQQETLQAYRTKEKLTDKQRIDWMSLEVKDAESKEFKLSDSQKKLLSRYATYWKYGRRPEIESKYFVYGHEVEKAGRDLLSEIVGKFLTQDTERKSNEYVTGMRDIKSDDIIIDIKNSYTLDTFYSHIVKGASDDYLWQLDCYMDLWKIKDALLVYTLIDTPGHMIEDELRRKNWNTPIFEFSGNVIESQIDVVKRLVCEHIYTRQALEKFCHDSQNVKIEWFDDFMEIPKHERLHMVEHSFDYERIYIRNESIRKCREFMNGIQVINNVTLKLF